MTHSRTRVSQLCSEKIVRTVHGKYRNRDEDDHDQQLYDALWLAHHHLALAQRPSLSFTFDYLHDDKVKGRYVEHHLRLHVEERDHLILLGLLQDFPTQSQQPKE